MNKTVLAKPGDRVGVFHSTTKTSVLLYGFGVYEGDEIPPDDILIPTVGPANVTRMKIPKLVLDDGQVLWGCEVWWTSEHLVQSLCEGYQIVKVKIESVRKNAQKTWEQANVELDEIEKVLP